jgi:hypothetical protein
MNTAAAMLFAARTAAWTLLFGGWLVLGTLALHHGPAGALQFAPLALWLGSVALAQQAARRRRGSGGGCGIERMGAGGAELGRAAGGGLHRGAARARRGAGPGCVATRAGAAGRLVRGGGGG